MQADVAWYKRNHVSGSSKQNFTPAYESVLVLAEQEKSAIAESLDMIDGVWDVPTKSHSGQHHYAIYPEELVEKIIQVATKPKDWVLDPFAGRGTTGIVCAEKGRKFHGIDLYANHVKVANHNIALHVKDKA
jgi:site-specific DNA-methyltransferase (adenine-specific)